MDSYSIIIKPHVTEKTMNLIDANNEITFVVRRSANKGQIKKAFEELYEEKGYKLPKLIFWNVNSRTKTIPMIENELGVTLVSGFSQNVLRMVMSNKYDPYEVLIEQITNPRYDMVRT